MKKNNGATLVTVLIILVLVTLLGTWAVKSSILGLKISTNSQVRSLLLENSNSALFNVEDPNQIARQLAMDGMFSYFNSADNSNDELVFCYRPSSMNTFYSMDKMSVIAKDGTTTKMGVPGFCKAGEFSSGRSAIQAQIYLQKNAEPDAAPFSTAPKGTSLGQSDVPLVALNIGVTVISILPSYANATNAQIEACFKKTAILENAKEENCPTSINSDVNKKKCTVEQCFDNLSIPYNLQHADYIVGGSPKLKS
ncbi:pilus assembly protein PilX [Acinetobacter sp. VNH17]|uniref:Pilus assembly protein PilX n=1 Tax=Acinetobacter thutiue TaxID=2998078 RepID=A0ABT7WP89_9GAMM|nr:pilus assembly protein PilX [Acinetobacter thutiue]MCY6412391.1 pilus assembly protein PilX [Acinetobacter thutiue]MDN0014495.1 pilus assembly protein PilX [Acinetobacter thutiue]